MKRNSKLSLALHALGHMAAMPNEPYRSQDIAKHNGTNAVVVRRVLGQLRHAGLLTSARGHAGGWRLAKPAQAISMADVYRAIGEPFFAKPADAGIGPDGCIVEKTLHAVMNDALFQAENELLAQLEAISIGDISASMTQRRLPGHIA